jgi:hypothetical protein
MAKNLRSIKSCRQLGFEGFEGILPRNNFSFFVG